MTTETTVRQTLRQAATTIPTGDTPLEQLVRRGRRRRHRNRGTVVAVVATAGLAGLSLGVPELQGHSPFATQAPTERTDVVIYLCSIASVNATLEPGQGPRCDAPATDAEISQLRSALALDESVAEVRLETQQQAYERFEELFADQPELVESVTPDTLPASLRIGLVDGVPIDEIVNHYREFDGVEEVVATETD